MASSVYLRNFDCGLSSYGDVAVAVAVAVAVTLCASSGCTAGVAGLRDAARFGDASGSVFGDCAAAGDLSSGGVSSPPATASFTKCTLDR